jgi:hypothetical protein
MSLISRAKDILDAAREVQKELDGLGSALQAESAKASHYEKAALTAIRGKLSPLLGPYPLPDPTEGHDVGGEVAGPVDHVRNQVEPLETAVEQRNLNARKPFDDVVRDLENAIARANDHGEGNPPL